MAESQAATIHPREGELPTWVLLVMLVGGAAVMLAGMRGTFAAVAGALFVVTTDGTMAALVLLAAGGFGWGVGRWLFPPEAPVLLRLATAAGLGLWLLATAMFVLGGAVAGAMGLYLWWTIVGAGAALAMAQAHRRLGAARFPPKVPGRILVWALVALAAGQWLAGLMLPPGWTGRLTGDAADVLGRYLQLPREYYLTGRVGPLQHNCYSYVPGAVEMLMLLGMCLRGSADEAANLARLIHGLFALVAIAASFGALRRDDDFRARAAVGLLATAPWVAYLFWPGMTQLAPMAYLTLALVWLRGWLARGGQRRAWLIGAALGGAASTGYDSILVVVVPVVIVMLGASVRRVGRARGALVAALVAPTMLSPWLIRNAVATGNPIFPMAADVLGRGHWEADSAERWRSVRGFLPAPAEGLAGGDGGIGRWGRLGRLALRRTPYTAAPPLSAGALLLAAGAAVAMLIRPRRASSWDIALLAVPAGQIAAWMLFTGQMPALFMSAAVPPIALLAAGGLSRLSRVKEVRWLRQRAGAGGVWGLAPATLLLTGVAVINLATTWSYFRDPRQIQRWGRLAYPPGTLLVGESRAMYFVHGVRYATVFDAQPIERFLGPGTDGPRLAARLRRAGITYVYISWAGIDAARRGPGWPEELPRRRLEGLFRGWPLWLTKRRSARTLPATRPATAPATGPQERGRLEISVYLVPDGPTAPAATTRQLDLSAPGK